MLVIVGAALVLGLAPVAAAASPPLVPLDQQAQIKRVLGQFGLGALAIVPRRAPSKYTFQATAMNSTQNVISFQKGSFVAYFTITFLNAKLDKCDQGATLILKVDGVLLYSKGYVVWRCISVGRKAVKMTAQGGGISREDLGTIVASARPISPSIP